MSNSLSSSSVNFRNRISLTQDFKSEVQIGGSYLYAFSNQSPTTKTFADNEWTSINETTDIHLHEGTIKLSVPLNKRGSSIELTADYLNRNSKNNVSSTNSKQSELCVNSSCNIDTRLLGKATICSNCTQQVYDKIIKAPVS